MHHSKNDDNQHISQKNQVLADQEHLKSCGYYALFEQATDAIMVTDFNGNFIDVNSSLCAMFGYTKNELLRMNVRSLIEKNDLLKNPIKFDKLALGENTLTKRKGIHKNGKVIYLESNAKKCGDDEILVIARNITEQKEQEDLLVKSEENLQIIFKNTDTVYVLMDKNLRIITLNERARMFGLNELNETMQVDGYFLDYFSADKRPALLQYLSEVIDGKQINYVVSYPQDANSFHWYSVKLFPIATGEAKNGVMMAVADITEKVRLEQKLEEERIKKHQEITDAVITAEENERHEIGQELHDNVNQLLATARLYLGISRQKPGTENHQLIEKALSFIDSATLEIRNLSHSFIHPFAEKYGFLQALDHLDGSISKSGMLTINKKIHVDENALDDKLKLTIYRIVQELLNNILKYAKATTVQINLIQEKKHITLTVKDNGVGFDTSKASSGMGLLNIRTRASLYNGRVKILSSPGHGCVVNVVLHTSK